MSWTKLFVQLDDNSETGVRLVQNPSSYITAYREECIITMLLLQNIKTATVQRKRAKKRFATDVTPLLSVVVFIFLEL
jgi:hypothetical protein